MNRIYHTRCLDMGRCICKPKAKDRCGTVVPPEHPEDEHTCGGWSGTKKQKAACPRCQMIERTAKEVYFFGREVS